jgi:signal peptidase I
MRSNVNKILSATALSIPPVILFHDNFFAVYMVRNDSMEPTLKQNDIVLVRKVDFFPYYHKHGLEMKDLEIQDSRRIDEETDRIKSMRMNASVGKPLIDEYTVWSSPPISLPGDIVAFKNPESFLPSRVEMKRIVGLGGQRVRRISSIPLYH